MQGTREAVETSFIDAIAEQVAKKLAEKLSLGPESITWLTVEEAAEHIQRDAQEVYKLIRKNEIPSHRAGPRCIRISQAELDEWLMSQ